MVQINDVRREVHNIPDVAEIAALGARAVLAQPVVHRRSVLATLVLLFDDPAMLDEETLRYITSVAALAALALERDRHLEEASQQRIDEFDGSQPGGTGEGNGEHE